MHLWLRPFLHIRLGTLSLAALPQANPLCPARLVSPFAIRVSKVREAHTAAALLANLSHVSSTEAAHAKGTRTNPLKATKRASRTAHVTIAKYIEWHSRGDLCMIRALKPEELVEVAQNAHLYTKENILDCLIQDLRTLIGDAIREDRCDGGFDKNYLPGVQAVLFAIVTASRKFSDHDILITFLAFTRSLQHKAELPSLPPAVVKLVLTTILRKGLAWATEDTAVLPGLIRLVEAMPVEELASMKYRISKYFFRLMQVLLDTHQDSLALRLVQVLVRSECIPSSIANAHDECPDDFRIITMSLLIRSCVYHKWDDIALQLLRKEDLKKRGSEEHFSKLVNALIAATLTRTHLCMKIIVGAILGNPSLSLSEKSLAGFFTSAHHSKDYFSAKTVYGILRSLQVRHKRSYDLPPSPVISWLMSSIAKARKDRIAGKLLARHVLETPDKVALYDRADVVGSCAKAEQFDAAQKLWHYYTAKPEGVLISANASCMLNIVKTFNANRLYLESPTSYSIGDGRSVAAALDTRTVDNYATCQDSKSVPVPEGLSGTSVGTGGWWFDEEAFALEYDGLVGGMDNLTDMSTQLAEGHDAVRRLAQARKLHDFALEVFNTFKESKKPLRYASHYDLNALSRAANELGLVRQSVAAMRALTGRKEVPDVRDLNVVISAMAKRNPVKAETMLRKVAAEGLQVDGQLLSTVIHEALDRGNLTVANRVFVLSSRFLSVPLPGAAGHRLLDAWLGAFDRGFSVDSGKPDATSVARRVLSQEEKDELRTYMANALSLLGTSDGKDSLQRRYLVQCMWACLRAEDGALAFRFWRMKRAGVGWKPEEAETTLRKAIEDQIRAGISEGRIGLDDAAKMDRELDGPRRVVYRRERKKGEGETPRIAGAGLWTR